MKYFQHCPECKLESVENNDKQLKRNRIGTDGYGQPVKFTECECGGSNKGYLFLDHYTNQGAEVDEGLLRYLKHRIDLYC